MARARRYDFLGQSGKTVSLIAGATLGLLGLLAGLGASYLMSNPTVAAATGKRISVVINRWLQRPRRRTSIRLGPICLYRNFVDIDISNLSSLDMPQSAIRPVSFYGFCAFECATAD